MTNPVLYRLGQYTKPKPGILYHLTSVLTDLASGIVTKAYQTQTYKRVITLSAGQARVMSASRTNGIPDGGAVDYISQTFLLDPPRGFSISLNDIIKVGLDTYIIRTVDIDNEIMQIGGERVAFVPLTVNGSVNISDDTLMSGTSVTEFSLYDLIYQEGTNIIRAGGDKPCLGIIVRTGAKYYHTRTVRVPELRIYGETTGPYIWLGSDGKPTFDRPQIGIQQQIGFATTLKGEGCYEALLDISDNITFA